MPTNAVPLFYSYAHEDEALLEKLDEHLTLLKRQGIISGWHQRDISAGSPKVAEIDRHLAAARIIVLLVSPAFIASDYCYGVEMQKAMQRHNAGTARVIPVLLRPCDWEAAPFGQLVALPANKKAVTEWANRDSAFTAITKGIRTVAEELNGSQIVLPSLKKTQTKRGEEDAHTPMLSAPTLNAAFLKKAVERYYKKLDEFQGKAEHELALRSAFQELLSDTAQSVKWTLIPEQTIDKGIRPDGVVRDGNLLPRGYWEAKGPKSDLEREIGKKINDGYPLKNIIFENTRKAVLYQGKKRYPIEFDLHKATDVGDLLQTFFTYTEPDIENFASAVQEFKVRIPEHAKALLDIIEHGYKENSNFRIAFDAFTKLCRDALDPKISNDVIKEMLIQHMLTERLFRTIFNNNDFVRRNVIAAEIEKVIDKLASRSFNRNEFLQSLDRFYVAIEAAARGIENWSERQHFLNTVYERFFQGYSIKRADTYGIVYTPQEIVDFMCASVDEVLKREFNTSIEEPDVRILDPATGTGSFIINLLHRIPPHKLEHKYKNDLFCNEIMLLPYYIASLNIEHEYYDKMGKYEPFEGVCFVDTLELAESRQLPLFVEENTERVKREKDAQIMVVIGNPPYNVGQKNENDNNKNRKYPIVDQRIRETYSRASQATLNNTLYDAYVRFFRWAIDRLQGRDGIVCLVTNNSFIDQIAFDGMRKHLLQDFTQIYHLDLHGNVRKNPKLSGSTHNVFGIQIGVGITVAVRNSKHSSSQLYYYRLPNDWHKEEKLSFLADKNNITRIDWQELQPDNKYTWLNEGLRHEFDTFPSTGTRASKSGHSQLDQTIFKLYSLGFSTSRDEWVYDFSSQKLAIKLQQLIINYNSEVFRWSQEEHSTSVDDFVNNNSNFIKWTDRLKEALSKQQMQKLDANKIRKALYRPFCTRFLYFDHLLNQRRYQQYVIFPNSMSELENKVICLTDLGSEKPFMALVSRFIPDLHIVGAGASAQCFPFYTYSFDGSNRQENITDWILTQSQVKLNRTITKWDIFHYVYCMLHHPVYRERYAENLKRDLPHIPLLHNGGGGPMGHVCAYWSSAYGSASQLRARERIQARMAIYQGCAV